MINAYKRVSICNKFINSTGLNAQELAENIEGVDTALIPKLHLCKGDYFSYTGKSPFNHLIAMAILISGFHSYTFSASESLIVFFNFMFLGQISVFQGTAYG